MLKRLLLGIIGLSLVGQALASNTVISDPSSVTPFRVCLTNDGPQSWPQGSDNPLSMLTPTQSIPFCLNQDLTLADYKQLSVFEKDIFTAVAMWASYFNSQNTLTINLVINMRSPRCSGDALPGSTETKSVSLLDGTQQDINVVYPSALHTLMNGTGGEGDNDYQKVACAGIIDGSGTAFPFGIPVSCSGTTTCTYTGEQSSVETLGSAGPC